MSSALKPWITSKEQGHKFIIRRDPRDLSRIYALHPKENVYVEGKRQISCILQKENNMI